MKTKSIIPGDQDNICFVCGRQGSLHEHHLLEGSCRQQSEIFGLKVHLCPACHEYVHHAKGKDMRMEFHKIAQTEFEDFRIGQGMSAEDAREDFIKHFIRSYL